MKPWADTTVREVAEDLAGEFETIDVGALDLTRARAARSADIQLLRVAIRWEWRPGNTWDGSMDKTP